MRIDVYGTTGIDFPRLKGVSDEEKTLFKQAMEQSIRNRLELGKEDVVNLHITEV